jgi:threonine/homoserine/homoserine lactone efflux protein
VFGIHSYGSFIAAVLVFQLIPGAGTISVLNATARNGMGGGMKAVFGTLSGDLIYMCAAVLGLAAILSTSPGVLAGVQWIGAGYLCWLGIKLLTASVTRTTVPAKIKQDGWHYFRQALAVSLTNPKVIMFFMAFFPLFMTPASTPFTLLVLMVHVTVISFLYQACLVMAGNAVAAKLGQRPWARRMAIRLAGVALIGFGVRLAARN